jgi:TolB-like protein/Tfp pilus assembly protein PilF
LSGTAQAVFISYASQDAEAASRICEALRAAGIEVWFDQSELRGGDAWDQSIRKQIKTCALFLPVISWNTHDRVEGYFRLEWKLAVDRSHLIAADQPFLLPVVIDGTRDDDERVPERFREVQWTHLPDGVTHAAFVERVRRLLSGELSQEPTRTASAAARVPAAPSTRKPVLALWRSKAALVATIAVLVVALGYLVVNRLVLSKRGAEVGAVPGSAAQSAPATAFNPPPHSIAVLPFVNMSGDKEQEYFSDGLSEELLNSLSRINELQVAARTSSFYFKGEHADLSTIAHKLNVASVLEGSVRRSGHTIRVTAQLNNAVTGFHLWSRTYDRDLGDVLKLQSEIADAVAGALSVTLLGDTAAKIELGGTHNPDAFDAYLRAEKLRSTPSAANLQAAIAAYGEAIRRDPAYALALAGRSIALTHYGTNFGTGHAIRENFDKAQADANRAIELAPDLAEGHQALAWFFWSGSIDLTRVSEEYDRAVALAPRNALILGEYGVVAALTGRAETGITAARRAVVLDPLSPRTRWALGSTLYFAHRYDDAAATLKQAISLDPDHVNANAFLGLSAYAQGDFQGAGAVCEGHRDSSANQWCLALTYEKLGRHADAESVLAQLKAARGEAEAYEYASIYAQWGNTAKALEWLTTAMRLRNPDLVYVKTDPLLDPLRNEPRFQAIERELKFPP